MTRARENSGACVGRKPDLSVATQAWIHFPRARNMRSSDGLRVPDALKLSPTIGPPETGG
ncbi:hypothetical protein BRAS3809_980015 [Bradyrhizobium sp. STM 3809]|nr:hypothetical protein BRAS3809_980015 [Bradyrhizobium sp. STM 3809]